ncbi:MAG: amino acid permease [Gammaproteobacteria bacterium]|nr:amino acid permease [Gammaproteobacteria bacterium]
MRATFLVASNMIGSGVYLLPATLGAFGSVSVIGWVVSGLGAFLLAAVFVLLYRIRPDSVGMVRQVRDGLGRFFGFHTSLLYWVGGWVGNVAIAVAATGYLSIFFPVLKGTTAAALCTLGVIWLMTLINFAGARRVTEFEGGTLLIGLLPVLGVAVLGWFAFDPVVFRESWNISGKADAQVIPATFALIFWAFVGVESASVAAAVVRNPARDVPIATLSGVALAASVYLAASVAISGLLPAADLGASSAPFADAAARWIGPAAAALVAGCAVLKAIGTLSGWVLVTAEVSRSGAVSRVFPAFFRESADGPPRRNLLIVAVLMSLIVVLSSLAPSLSARFTMLINIATLLYLVIYAYCCAALWRFTGHRGIRFVALLAAGFCLWAISASELQQLVYLAVLCGLGALLYLGIRDDTVAR